MFVVEFPQNNLISKIAIQGRFITVYGFKGKTEEFKRHCDELRKHEEYTIFTKKEGIIHDYIHDFGVMDIDNARAWLKAQTKHAEYINQHIHFLLPSLVDSAQLATFLNKLALDTEEQKQWLLEEYETHLTTLQINQLLECIEGYNYFFKALKEDPHIIQMMPLFYSWFRQCIPIFADECKTPLSADVQGDLDKSDEDLDKSDIDSMISFVSSFNKEHLLEQIRDRFASAPLIAISDNDSIKAADAIIALIRFVQHVLIVNSLVNVLKQLQENTVRQIEDDFRKVFAIIKSLIEAVSSLQLQNRTRNLLAQLEENTTWEQYEAFLKVQKDLQKLFKFAPLIPSPQIENLSPALYEEFRNNFPYADDFQQLYSDLQTYLINFLELDELQITAETSFIGSDNGYETPSDDEEGYQHVASDVNSDEETGPVVAEDELIAKQDTITTMIPNDGSHETVRRDNFESFPTDVVKPDEKTAPVVANYEPPARQDIFTPSNNESSFETAYSDNRVSFSSAVTETYENARSVLANYKETGGQSIITVMERLQEGEKSWNPYWINSDTKLKAIIHAVMSLKEGDNLKGIMQNTESKLYKALNMPRLLPITFLGQLGLNKAKSMQYVVEEMATMQPPTVL